MPAMGLEQALNSETGAPEWVQLLPAGKVIRARDGRSWQLADPVAVIRAFNAGGIDLPVDYEHQDDDATRRSANGPVPAAGWIKELRHDQAQGLLGRVEWTATARRLIEAREYRYLSPVFTYTGGGAIKSMKGASLVHKPALTLQALAREETRPMTDNTLQSALARVATALGLDQSADEGAILTAINAMQGAPDPARFVPIEAVRELMEERARSQANTSEEVAHARVEAAMSAGYLTPAMRDWAVALCRADPESFEEFVQSATPAYAHLFEKSARPSLNSERQSTGLRPKSAEEAAVFAQLGLDANSGT